MLRIGSLTTHDLRLTTYVLFSSLALWLGSCASVEPTAKVDNSLEQELGPYTGPKASIAVSKFSWKADGAGGGTKKSKKISFFGQAIEYQESEEHKDEANALQDMLTTALVQSKRYKVMERGEMGVINQEQELGASGAVEEKSAAKRGAIKGADILVVAAVTAWEPGVKNTGGGLGGFLGKRYAILGAAGSVGMKKSYLAIDMRIIDSSTSEVLAATNVQGEAKEFKMGVFGGGLLGGVPLGGGLSSYAKTPFEKAIRVCIKEAVKYIVANTPEDHYKYK